MSLSKQLSELVVTLPYSQALTPPGFIACSVQMVKAGGVRGCDDAMVSLHVHTVQNMLYGSHIPMYMELPNQVAQTFDQHSFCCAYVLYQSVANQLIKQY